MADAALLNAALGGSVELDLFAEVDNNTLKEDESEMVQITATQ